MFPFRLFSITTIFIPIISFSSIVTYPKPVDASEFVAKNLCGKNIDAENYIREDFNNNIFTKKQLKYLRRDDTSLVTSQIIYDKKADNAYKLGASYCCININNKMYQAHISSNPSTVKNPNKFIEFRRSVYQDDSTICQMIWNN